MTTRHVVVSPRGEKFGIHLPRPSKPILCLLSPFARDAFCWSSGMKCNRRWLAALVGLVVGFPVLAADLDAQIQSVLADKLLKNANVGIEFVRLGSSPQSSKVVYEHESHGK